jgi:hypothetical protein
MPSFTARILILCKTYPSPSGKNIETSCVAGLDEDGRLIRLFPVPFRLIDGAQRFKKWQWITARIDKATGDRRRESHKIFVDTIECDPTPISTARGWADRRTELEKLPVFPDFDALESARISDGTTLALVQPKSIVGLDITPERPDWTEDEREKLLRNEQQMGLFDSTDARTLATLRKLPFGFYYRYQCEVEGAVRTYRHKIVDWEIGALYWNCRRDHGDAWEGPFRKKLEEQLPAADLMFLMGTIHRFPDQWLIVSVIYPPKRTPEDVRQPSLFG